MTEEERKKKLREFLLEDRAKVMKDFVFESKVSEQIIEKYKKLLPVDITELWTEYGYGSFADGFIKIINPDEYYQLWVDKTNFYPDAIPLFVTGFGDLIVYNNRHLKILLLRDDDFDELVAVPTDLSMFYTTILEEVSREKDLNYYPYDEAKQKYGPLQYDECYGFFPIIPTGGSENLDNIKIVKIKEYIQLHIELLGPIITQE